MSKWTIKLTEFQDIINGTNNFEKCGQLRNFVTLMKLNILQKLFRNCQREDKLEHQCKTWQFPYSFRNKHMITISRIKLWELLFM